MERVDVGVIDNEALNNETVVQSPQSQNPSNAETGESSNPRPVLYALVDPDLFECPICTIPLNSIVYQCINGHYVCASCCERMNQKCPFCPKLSMYIRCLAIERVADSALSSCDACQEKVSYHLKQVHEDTCQYNPVTPCRYKKFGCNEEIRSLKKVEHEKTCQFIPLSCPYYQCRYIAEPRALYQHHAQHPKAGAYPFTFNVYSNLKFNMLCPNILLMEREEKILFVAERIIDSNLGSFVNVRCIAPPTLLGMKFSYELCATKVENCFNIRSGMDLEPIAYKLEISEDNCHLFGKEFHTGSLETTINLRFVIRKLD